MVGKIRLTRWLLGAALLAAVDGTGVAALDFALTSPAHAQFFGGPRSRPQRSGFFDGMFGNPNQNRPVFEDEPSQAPADYSHAPSPRKPDSKADQAAPTTSIIVMGDGMADWLAYGLEDAFSDTPEIGILRRNKAASGLLRYDAKGDLDWWHAARDILAPEKPSYVIMMLGVNDRMAIREKDLVKDDKKKEADKKEAEKAKTADKSADKPDAGKDGQDKDAADKKDAVADKDRDAEDPDQPSIMAPEPKRAGGSVEFRSDKWAEIYSRRIDDTIAALKSKGVPVFWVGLPAIKGPKSTADAVYLNDLYRARAEKAGAIYIDVWDGFVDEGGKFTTNGPDYEGQVRRLRSGDGVYFTKYGARKLAHYVERELRRYMSNRSLQISFPTGPVTPLPSDGKSAARPLAGPVVPLTVTPGNSDDLLGSANTSSPHGDAIATSVLVKGEPLPAPPGRADDFARHPSDNGNAAVAAVPVNAPAIAPEPPVVDADKKPADGKRGKAAQNAVSKTRQRDEGRPRPTQPVAPRQAGPLGWLR
ncbi:MAG TPA: DUF459 domain-containing protein [Pseudolabrys sp.]